MPIMASVLPVGEEESLLHGSMKVQHPIPVKDEKRDSDSGFGDCEEFDSEGALEDSCDIDGSLDRRSGRRKMEEFPVPPQASDKRTAEIMKSSGMLELRDTDDCKTPRVVEQHAIVSDPHELYLSSEEEGSLSDDYEGSLFDFDDNGSDLLEEAGQATHSRTSSRGSQAESARVISIVVVGKPQIINIHIQPPAPQRRSLSYDLNTITHESFTRPRPVATRRPTPLKLYPTSLRRMSISSIASISTHTSSIPSQQSQTSSFHPRRLASNLNSLITSTKNSIQNKQQHHSFLDSDPFASNEADEYKYSSEQSDYDHRPITPKTPTSAAAAAWRKGLSRTLSIARKPSIPLLNLAAQRNSSKLDLAQIAADASVREHEVENEKLAPQRAVTMPVEDSLPTRVHSRAEDLMRKVIRGPQPPSSPKGRRTGSISMSMIGLGRRKGY